MLIMSFLLMGMDRSVYEADDRKQLLEREAQLTAQIASFRNEQDFLLFQKSFIGSDSKYLIFDLASGTGTFKYRNRTLRSFALTVPLSIKAKLRQGRYALTAKADGQPQQRALIFQDSLVISGKRYSGGRRGEKKLPVIVIGRRDLAAIFFAVEQGSMLYLRQ